MKFSPKCRTKKLGMLYTILVYFCSFLNGKGRLFSPKSGLGKSLILVLLFQAIYPFVSEVTCDYTLGGKKTLDSVSCLQQQYFKPLSYHGDILATAMANIRYLFSL